MDTRTATLPGLPAPEKAPPNDGPVLAELRAPLWSEDKADLIAEYIHRFLFVTKHGVYLDLFAGPQREDNPDAWSVRRVLERRTSGPAMTRYVLCDIDREQVESLNRLVARYPQAQIHIHRGDANVEVHAMLAAAQIRRTTPCFCLADQRTLECHWSTIQTVARYKGSGYKIELFYFLAERWLMRSVYSLNSSRKLDDWWGRSDHGSFLRLPSFHRALELAGRFEDELGYAYAKPYSIHEKGPRSRTMYYMIHATDHPRAPRLMSDAYRHISAKRSNGGEQLDLIG